MTEENAPQVFINWVKENLPIEEEIVFDVKITAGKSKTEIFDILDDGTIKIRVNAQVENGKANKALVKYLKNLFLCEVEIVSGEISENKKIRLSTNE